MGKLRLVGDAEAAFRVEVTDAFDVVFAMNFYGSHGRGWFVATYRGADEDNRDTGPQPLPPGKWRALLKRIERSGFWELPADSAHTDHPDVMVDDGEWVTLAGRDHARYHRIRRFIWREAGLNEVIEFCREVSGLFAPPACEGTPMQLDTRKIDDAVLALLYLGLHGGARAWKGFDWDAMDRLCERGYITEPRGKAKSVVFTKEGLERARTLLYELFGKENTETR